MSTSMDQMGWRPPYIKPKLTPQQRYDIQQRRWAGEDPKDLAIEFNITAGYVRNLAPLNG